ncbi:MAG: S26 family signal peptidase [Alphaproteobacteria bacterium]|nr:S26 family signal peptidase [Alphaproteobacteria bacterium]
MSARQILATIIGACALIAASEHRTPHLVWNATASAPIGLYRVVSRDTLHHGDLVLALPPRQLQQFASQRGYLPLGVSLVKHVAALTHDRVCGWKDAVTINGTFVVLRLAIDRLRRPLPAWYGCRTLAASDVLLLNTGVATSFDGRYFGPISTSAILGKLVPLWTR